MTTIDLPWCENPAAEITQLAQNFGLTLEVHTLRTFPGSRHWHLRIPKRCGTLELTWWPQQSRFWLSIQDKRQADWQPAVIEHLMAHFKLNTT